MKRSGTLIVSPALLNEAAARQLVEVLVPKFEVVRVVASRQADDPMSNKKIKAMSI